jgi:hypothetical protein
VACAGAAIGGASQFAPATRGADPGNLLFVLWPLPPGRYHVDEISADPLPSGHTSRRWGAVITVLDGSVELEPAQRRVVRMRENDSPSFGFSRQSDRDPQERSAAL